MNVIDAVGAAILRDAEDADRFRAALEDLASHGCRHDLNPTHVRLGEGPSGGWESYIQSMDAYVRTIARRALQGQQ